MTTRISCSIVVLREKLSKIIIRKLQDTVCVRHVLFGALIGRPPNSVEGKTKLLKSTFLVSLRTCGDGIFTLL